jgi:hypothetical protein
MKHWKTTDVGPTAVTKDTHRAVKGAANQFLREKNGRLPLNLAKHSRLSLLKLIKELNHELSVANNWVQHHQNHCDDLIKENAALREAKDAYFKHNNILVQLMTEEQKKKALDILIKPTEAQL